MQETFVSIWRSARELPARARRRRRLAVRRRAQRDRRPDAARTAAVETPPSPSSCRPRRGPDERAEQAWTQLAGPPGARGAARAEREVIALAYWSDLSQSEVASFLGHPLGTVKTRTRNALAQLAEVLEGDAMMTTSTSWSTPSRRERSASGCCAVHELLLEAGPPPELTPSSRRGPTLAMTLGASGALTQLAPAAVLTPRDRRGVLSRRSSGGASARPARAESSTTALSGTAFAPHATGRSKSSRRSRAPSR